MGAEGAAGAGGGAGSPGPDGAGGGGGAVVVVEAKVVGDWVVVVPRSSMGSTGGSASSPRPPTAMATSATAPEMSTPTRSREPFTGPPWRVRVTVT